MTSRIALRSSVFLAALLAVACGVCVAQATPVEVPINESASEAKSEPKKAATPKKTPASEDLSIVPILEADPDNPNEARKPEAKAKKPVLVREGKRLFDRDGHITRAGSDSVFVFASGDTEPMVLVPCRPLERTENLSKFGRKELQFTVSGTVSEYRDRNYLLMTDTPRMIEKKDAAAGEADSGETDATPAGSKAGDSPKTSPPAAPRDRNVPPSAGDVDIPPAPPAPKPKPTRSRTSDEHRGPARRSSSPDLLPEDKRLLDREGRIVREGENTIFVFDNGDKPIVLLPNQKLQKLEDLSEYGQKPMRFRISGRVTEYRGRNYLMTSKVVIIPKAVERL